ncbi:YheC/YheD family endospore coat-associated protein [Chengkuizengella axinellae]|uniref:YheC/YheD family protein n=1 Tax=Chengkuizengella axinellae TaxID=3064388 RepID=A0ABT9IYF8_9BACL|nr:YheC/YheD family protein [Chengkuizengella sp. 2205SS18-9]MDP5274396.1 YheC/YheD family protein [Chengkuizengella sp. 2205SS18-9]
MNRKKRKSSKVSQNKIKPKSIIGILTLSKKKSDFFGAKQNFIDIIAKGRQFNQEVYVVTTKDLKLNQNKINGYYYDENQNQWNTKKIPIPSVLYNRISNRKLESLPETKRLIINCLNHKHIHVFNPFFFNKWSLFKWLRKSKKIKVYVPLTQKLIGFKEINNLFKKFDTLYIKPIKGKAGSGIMRIKKNVESDFTYELKIQGKKTIGTYQFNTLQELNKEIKKNIIGGEYIVQQGIELATNHEHPFDLRVLAQKNGSGIWNISGIGARVAGEKSITTHVPRGGRIDDPQKLLTSFFGVEEATQILQKVRNTTLNICKQIEKASTYQLGEMSMDLGIDKNGGIWFFEANSKPMKFDEPQIRDQSLVNIIKYSQYLMKHRKNTSTRKLKRRKRN